VLTFVIDNAFVYKIPFFVYAPWLSPGSSVYYQCHFSSNQLDKCLLCVEIQNRVAAMFQNSKRQIQIYSARWVTRPKYHAWGPRMMTWPAYLTVVWRFILGGCKLIQIFIRKVKPAAVIMLKMLDAAEKKISRMRFLRAWHKTHKGRFTSVCYKR
jgi:hypothetical protein